MATNPNKTPPAAAADAAAPATTSAKALRVVSRREVFWRCGIKFGADPVDVPLAELDAGMVARLKAEPQLVVTEVELAPGA